MLADQQSFYFIIFQEKSKDDTWGEKELSKHIGKNTGSRKPAAYGYVHEFALGIKLCYY